WVRPFVTPNRGLIRLSPLAMVLGPPSARDHDLLRVVEGERHELPRAHHLPETLDVRREHSIALQGPDLPPHAVVRQPDASPRTKRLQEFERLRRAEKLDRENVLETFDRATCLARGRHPHRDMVLLVPA